MKEHENGQGTPETQQISRELKLAGGQQERQGDTEPSFLPDEERGWSGRTHQELVEGFKGYLRYWQDRLHKDHGEPFLPIQIIRNELGWYKDLTDDQTRAFVTPLALAWSVLTHDHYELGTSGEQTTGMEVQMYYQQTQKPIIRLSESQVEILDALAEAVDIPRERGQAEIPIPDKLKKYSEWYRSKEYQQRVFELRSWKKRS